MRLIPNVSSIQLDRHSAVCGCSIVRPDDAVEKSISFYLRLVAHQLSRRQFLETGYQLCGARNHRFACLCKEFLVLASSCGEIQGSLKVQRS